jgi:hypothetical protein
MAGYNTIKGLRVKYLSEDPSNPEDGQVWYNSGTGNLRVDGIGLAGSWASSTAIPTGTQRMGAAGTSNSASLLFGGDNPSDTAQTATYEGNSSSWTGGGALGTATANMARWK